MMGGKKKRGMGLGENRPERDASFTKQRTITFKAARMHILNRGGETKRVAGCFCCFLSLANPPLFGRGDLQDKRSPLDDAALNNT